MKKFFILFTALQIIPGVLSSVSGECIPDLQLEKLWKASLNNSVDYKSALLSVEYAETALKKKQSLYPFSFKTNVSSSFNDIYPDVTWYPSSSNVSATLTKQNHFGNSVSGSVSYSVTRNVLDIFEDVDSGNIGYSHSPSVDLTIQQSLKPAVLRGNRNPEIEILKKNIQSAKFSKDNLELALLRNVSNYYIQERCVLRDINKYKAWLDFYSMKIDAAAELLENKKIAISELWNLENQKWEYYQDYLQSINTKENLELALVNLCGTGEFVRAPDITALLPDSETSYLNTNPEKLNLENQIQILKNQNLLTKQNTAPFLSLSGSFTENTATNEKFYANYIEDKINFNWNFSLGISFSDLFSASRKLKEEVFENNLTVCSEQLRALEEKTQNELKNFEKIIESYQKQIEKMELVLEHRKILCSDYEILYKAGKCSLLDFKEVQLGVQEAQCLLENLKDNLWLYKWERSQCR